ncbi:hypothetical protein FNH05_17185 [Amycolatopsis rhizosphaerae]|uniref:Uncharacterized protein n=1 Tax=Amycolatopsis rhizosphaerae TaxID=2053003 RepID=A0A558CKH2_9PSEU|nr:hypothetical protein FNH05_17185 [Amycolatopsis rhizosphaerae]
MPRPAPVETRVRRGRWWRGATGSLAAGMAGLAVIVLGAGVLSLIVHAPGPGAASLIGHPVAAVVALAAQRVADRRQGPPAVLAGAVVLVDVAATLWLLWWS